MAEVKERGYSGERVTPLSEIPPEFRKVVPLPGGNEQVVDIRLCYNLEVGEDGARRLVECGSVAWDSQVMDDFAKPNL